MTSLSALQTEAVVNNRFDGLLVCLLVYFGYLRLVCQIPRAIATAMPGNCQFGGCPVGALI